ncbi:MAG: anthranilate phosphoribosyltransferase, partial [Nitrospinota bacterium]|nr:anthranilate phosphoribosyltransferase [Nitrospinota bacterium]
CVLKSLGVNIEADKKVVEQCLEEAGIGFLFAPMLHGAMKHAAGVRKELGIRTIFNLLGPLTNPAGAHAQVVGVFDRKWVSPVSQVLKNLGCHHAFVVHGEDGLDEITLTGNTRVYELNEGKIMKFYVNPENFGLARCKGEDLAGGTPEENATIIRDLLSGKTGSKRDIVLLNAAAAIVVGGKVKDLKEGLEAARESIDSGAAQKKLEALRKISQG